MRLFVHAAAGGLALLALAAGLPPARAGLGVGPEPPPAPPPPPATPPSSISPLPSGTLVIGGLSTSGITFGPGSYTLSTAVPEPQAATPYADGPAMGAAFSSRDGTLFAIILPGQIEVRKADNLDVVARLPMPTTPRLALAFTQDNQSLLVAGGDRALQRWDLATRKKTAELPLAELPAGSVEGMYFAFAAGGAKLGVAADGVIYCFDAAAGKLLWRAHDLEAAGPLAFTAGGFRLVAATAQGKTVQVFDAGNGAKLNARTSLGQPVNALAVAPDDSTIAAATSDGRLNIWSLAPGDERTATHTLGPLLYDRGSLVFSPDSRGLLLVQRHPQVNVSSPAAHSGEQVTLAFVLIGTGYRLQITPHNAADSPWGLPVVYAPDGQSAHLVGPTQIEPYAAMTANPAAGTPRVPATVIVPKDFRVARSTDNSLAILPDAAAGAEAVVLVVGTGSRFVYNAQMRLYEDGSPGTELASSSAGGTMAHPGPGGTVDATPMFSRPFLSPATLAGLDPAKKYVVELLFSLREQFAVSGSSSSIVSAGSGSSPMFTRTLRQTFVPGTVPADPTAPSRRGGLGRGGGGAGGGFGSTRAGGAP